MDALATHRRLDQPPATWVTFVTLGVGAAVAVLTRGSDVSASLFLIAMLVASQSNRRSLIIGAALFATVAHLLPALVRFEPMRASPLQISASQLVWASLYWIAAALLIWIPRQRSLGIKQVHEAFAHAPAAMALVDTSGTIVHANGAFIKLVGPARRRVGRQQSRPTARRRVVG